MDAEPDIRKARAELEGLLFSDPFLKAYAVVDGARRLDLLSRLDEFAPPCECLYIGDAKASALPGLRVLNKRSRASHSVSFYRVGEEQLFYLATRGISERAGKRLLRESFENLIRVKLDERE